MSTTPEPDSAEPLIPGAGADVIIPLRRTISKDFLQVVPEDVFIKIFSSMVVDEMIKCRQVCTVWNEILCNNPELIPARTCFYFDGRKDDNGVKVTNYLDSGLGGCSLWNTIRVRSCSIRHLNWIDITRTKTITHLEFHNCSLHWSTVIKVLMEFDNLSNLQDIQDMYCWDYAMFNEGISEEQTIPDTTEYPQFVETGRLDLISNLQFVKIHRSNIRDCTTYLKILELRCNKIEALEITTDCNFPQGRSAKMYCALANLLRKNSRSLNKLRFPFKNIYSQYDFRLTEDQRPFRDFLNYISREAWATHLELEALTELHLSFPMIYLEQEDVEVKLKPVIFKPPNLQKLKLSSVNLEPSKEDILLSIAPENVKTEFDLYVNDGRNIPYLIPLIPVISSLSVQTWRISAVEVKTVLSLNEDDETILYDFTKELQYFSKSHTFRDFNIDLLCASFAKITHLNLVDHNTRVEHRHASEAVAAIEDEHFQMILKSLEQLRTLQIIANMAYLTDAGTTGLKLEACKRMKKRNSFIKLESDVEGVPISNLKYLRTLVLRGVGIKITDVTLHFAFGSMERLKKIHIFGAQQTTPQMRANFHQKFPNLKGYDLDI
jgi:hypothetical protein